MEIRNKRRLMCHRHPISQTGRVKVTTPINVSKEGEVRSATALRGKDDKSPRTVGLIALVVNKSGI